MAIPDEDWQEFSARVHKCCSVSIDLNTTVINSRCDSSSVSPLDMISCVTVPPDQAETIVPEQQPLSAKKRGTSLPPVTVQDMTSLIEEFTADSEEVSPADVNKAKVKARPFVEETSTITTPGNTQTSRTGVPAARSKPSVVPRKSSVMATAKQSAAKSKAKGKKTVKPELVTPTEFARRLREQVTSTASPLQSSASDLRVDSSRGKGREKKSAKPPLVKAIQQPPQHLKDHVIFYTGGDLTYASARTRGCMTYVRRALFLATPVF